MNNNVKDEVKKFLEKTEDNLKYFIDHSMGIAASIEDILEKKGMRQKELAEKMNKKESEISKWLSGSHNFTIDTIAKIEEALGEKLIFTKYDLEDKEKIIYKYVYIYKEMSNINVDDNKYVLEDAA